MIQSQEAGSHKTEPPNAAPARKGHSSPSKVVPQSPMAGRQKHCPPSPHSIPIPLPQVSLIRRNKLIHPPTPDPTASYHCTHTTQ